MGNMYFHLKNTFLKGHSVHVTNLCRKDYYCHYLKLELAFTLNNDNNLSSNFMKLACTLHDTLIGCIHVQLMSTKASIIKH